MALAVIVTTVVVCVGVYGYSRIGYWRTCYEQETEKYAEVLDKAIAAEHIAANFAQQVKWMQEYMGGQQKQPVFATLTDEQASKLTQGLVAYLAAQGLVPAQMN